MIRSATSFPFRLEWWRERKIESWAGQSVAHASMSKIEDL